MPPGTKEKPVCIPHECRFVITASGETSGGPISTGIHPHACRSVWWPHPHDPAVPALPANPHRPEADE